MYYTKSTYEIEDRYLSPYAQKSAETKGRERGESACGMRTEYQRDRDRILHCKSFRRLKHKTQVFLAPEGDHYRTRLTHTLEVSQVARSLARALRLNEDLVEAISLGHDLGHTPFGHAGERALNDICKDSLGGFKHSAQSRRMVDILEYEGKGLNLTYEVRSGILNHSSSGKPETLEARLVCLADQIAYLNHDIDDAVRAGVLSLDDIPRSVQKQFGYYHSKRINNMVTDVLENSYGKNFVEPSKEGGRELKVLRDFMMENVYGGKAAKAEEPKVHSLIGTLFDYYLSHKDLLPEYIERTSAKLEQKVCDYIAMMSDNFLIKTYEELFVPKGFADN